MKRFRSTKCSWQCGLQTLGHFTIWRHQIEAFPRYWPYVLGTHRWPKNSPHKGQWRGALMFSLICAWMNGWVNNHGAGDWRLHRAHYVVIVKTRASMCQRINLVCCVGRFYCWVHVTNEFSLVHVIKDFSLKIRIQWTTDAVVSPLPIHPFAKSFYTWQNSNNLVSITQHAWE